MQIRLQYRKVMAAFALATAPLIGAALVEGPIAGAATHVQVHSTRTAFFLRPHLAVNRARVDTVGTTSFTVLTRRRVLTINVLPGTIFRVYGQTGAYGDISANEEVRVFGTYAGANGTVNASFVNVLASAKVVAWGTVQSIGSTSFIILRGGQMWTIDTTDSTQYRLQSDQTTTTSNELGVGDSVRVFATRTATAGTLTALAVAILVQPIEHAAGFITSIGTNSFTVLHDQANLTVDVNRWTKYRISGILRANLGDLVVGDPVSVTGTATSTVGTIEGHVVLVITKQPHAVIGEVSSIGTGSFTVVHRQANLNVDVTSGTQFFALYSGATSFGDLATGDRVLLSLAHSAIAGTVNANWVLILDS